jgi:hypothetical protein
MRAFRDVLDYVRRPSSIGPSIGSTQQQTARSPENVKYDALSLFHICKAILGSEVPLHTYIRPLSPDAFEAMK